VSDLVTLKEHFEALRADDKEALQLALGAADKAVNKAEEAQLRVNQTQNEFRGTLKDQAATLMPRTEVEQLIKGLNERAGRTEKVVYVGIGIVISLQFLIPLLLR
jgi:hypothetical protein